MNTNLKPISATILFSALATCSIFASPIQILLPPEMTTYHSDKPIFTSSSPMTNDEKTTQDSFFLQVKGAWQTHIKIASIVLPDLEFDQAPVVQAVENLRKLSIVADSEMNINKKGVNVFVVYPQGYKPPNIRISLHLKKPTLEQTLIAAARESNFEMKIEKIAVVLAPRYAEQGAAANP